MGLKIRGAEGEADFRASGRLPAVPAGASPPAYCMDSKNSMPLLSAVRVTMAFFQAGVRPS